MQASEFLSAMYIHGSGVLTLRNVRELPMKAGMEITFSRVLMPRIVLSRQWSYLQLEQSVLSANEFAIMELSSIWRELRKS